MIHRPSGDRAIGRSPRAFAATTCTLLGTLLGAGEFAVADSRHSFLSLHLATKREYKLIRYAAEEARQDPSTSTAAPILRKPYKRAELATALRDALLRSES